MWLNKLNPEVALLGLFFLFFFGRSAKIPTVLTTWGCYLSFFSALAYAILKKKARYKFACADLIFAAYVVFVLFSTVVSICRGHSLHYVFKELWIVMIYLFLRLFFADSTRIVLYLMAFSLFVLCIASAILSPHVPPITGLFSHKNTFGIFAEMDFLILVSNWFAPAIVILVLVLASGCRLAVIISFVFGMLAIWKFRRKLFAKAVVAFVAFSFFVLALFPQVSKRFTSLARFKDKSFEDRLAIMKASYGLALRRFPYGWGYRRPWKCLCKRYPSVVKGAIDREELFSFICRGGAHNTPLELLFEGGIVGAIFGVLLYFYAFYFFLKGFVFDKSINLETICFLLLLALLVHGVGEVILYSKRGVLLFSILALCGNAEVKKALEGCCGSENNSES